MPQQADPSNGVSARPSVGVATAQMNAVRLEGKVTSEVLEKELPSGTLIATFRISVPRCATTMTRGSRQTTDWVDCVAWTARTRRVVTRWQVGDVVELHGALRRRFYRATGGASTRLEVEVLRGRRVRSRS